MCNNPKERGYLCTKQQPPKKDIKSIGNFPKLVLVPKIGNVNTTDLGL